MSDIEYSVIMSDVIKSFDCIIFMLQNTQDAVFVLLINVKMPKIVGILSFMSRKNFTLS